MNEELQNSLVGVLDKTLRSLDSSVDFIEAPLPDAMEQLLTWYVVESLVYTAVGVGLFVAFLVLTYMGLKSTKGFLYYKDVDNTLVVNHIGVIFLGLGFTSGYLSVGFLQNIMTALQIWVAPKIWAIGFMDSLAS